jgi:hypothetical protein
MTFVVIETHLDEEKEFFEVPTKVETLIASKKFMLVVLQHSEWEHNSLSHIPPAGFGKRLRSSR